MWLSMVRSPHVDIAVIRAAHNGIAAEYPRWLACKQVQHGKFGSSQGNVLPLPTGGVLLWLNGELTQAQFTGGNRRTAWCVAGCA